jgi:hypothetical protein
VNPPAPTPIVTPPVGSVYTVQLNDTFASIAAAHGISINDLLAVNSQLWNVSFIAPGQIINLPVSANVTPDSSTPSTAPTPTFSVAPAYSVLRITVPGGLIVRTGPNRFYPVIDSNLVNSVYGTSWWYRKNSLTADVQGFLWVEVTLNAKVKDYTTGWIQVKDTLGHYFTTPNLDLR